MATDNEKKLGIKKQPKSLPKDINNANVDQPLIKSGGIPPVAKGIGEIVGKAGQLAKDIVLGVGVQPQLKTTKFLTGLEFPRAEAYIDKAAMESVTRPPLFGAARTPAGAVSPKPAVAGPTVAGPAPSTGIGMKPFAVNTELAGYGATPAPPAGAVKPPVKRPHEDINAGIDALIKQLMEDPKSRATQNMGLQVNPLTGKREELIKTGGIKNKILGRVVELRKAQLTGAYGLTGEQMRSESDEAKLELDVKKHEHEIKKYAKSNDLTDPKNLIKLFSMINVPTTKETITDPNTLEKTVIETPDYSAAFKVLKSFGIPIPKAALDAITATKPGNNANQGAAKAADFD